MRCTKTFAGDVTVYESVLFRNIESFHVSKHSLGGYRFSFGDDLIQARTHNIEVVNHCVAPLVVIHLNGSEAVRCPSVLRAETVTIFMMTYSTFIVQNSCMFVKCFGEENIRTLIILLLQ